MRKPYSYSNSKPVEEKNYLQVNVCDAISRDDARTELAWSDLCDHHLFRGNDTMMVLERFYWEGCDLDELNQERNEVLSKISIDPRIFDTMSCNELYTFRDNRNYENDVELNTNMACIVILEYLQANGYDLDTIDTFDGVLLNITW